jgi:hypothetical protein
VVASVRPVSYAGFVSPADHAAIRDLGPGGALEARTEVSLRNAGAGLHLFFDGDVHVDGAVSNASTQGYELLTRAAPPGWGDRFYLVRPASGARTKLAARIRSSLPPGTLYRIRSRSETPYLRYADAVPPQMAVKMAFGEFAAVREPGGRLGVEPAWRARHIVAARVRVLGRVTCNRALIPDLRAAMRDLQRQGLAHLVDSGDYEGCYSPRFIVSDPSAGISRHSWGAAVDLNASANPYGSPPHQDRRLVEAMERHGFTWGGRWLRPDGMHFEWAGRR